MYRIISESVASDSILLLVNEDMYLTDLTVKHCRSISSEGKRVYFPVAFGQYDPDIIEKGMPPGKPTNVNKMDHTKFTGSWLHDRNNALCAYRSDFMSVLTTLFSIDTTLEGVLPLAYNVFLQKNIEVVNAVEPGLYRRHSTAKCSSTDKLSKTDQEHCFNLKASQLGSKPALGILYLTEIVNSNV